MSYILDALKKSEQERGQGNIPSVQTVHSSSLNYGNQKNTYWPYILITAILLNFLAITYFIFDKEKSLGTDTSPNEVSDTHIMQSSTDPTEEDTNKIDKAFTHTTNTKNTNEVSDVDMSKQSNLATSKIAPAVEATAKPGKIKINKISHKDNITKPLTEYETRGKIKDYYDLSESEKNNLPGIIISAHVYSTNPLQRSIVINNDFMEEGEYVKEDFILHEITRDGAIFNYKGDLINYSVVSKWQ